MRAMAASRPALMASMPLCVLVCSAPVAAVCPCWSWLAATTEAVRPREADEPKRAIEASLWDGSAHALQELGKPLEVIDPGLGGAACAGVDNGHMRRRGRRGRFGKGHGDSVK